jgi:hypothetical protein
LYFKKASEKIASYDKNLSKATFTFGIIYQKVGQISEREIFDNTEHSNEFEEFLNFIGNRVQLKSFSGFDIKFYALDRKYLCVHNCSFEFTHPIPFFRGIPQAWRELNYGIFGKNGTSSHKQSRHILRILQTQRVEGFIHTNNSV